MLVFVTISNNTGLPDSGSAAHTDGIHNLGDVTSQLTIHANGNGSENCNAHITSAGNNIDTANSCGLNSAGDKTNTAPMIGVLADNGGLTDTHAILDGSPAIDAGGANCPMNNDQRGQPRPPGQRLRHRRLRIDVHRPHTGAYSPSPRRSQLPAQRRRATSTATTTWTRSTV